MGCNQNYKSVILEYLQKKITKWGANSIIRGLNTSNGCIQKNERCIRVNLAGGIGREIELTALTAKLILLSRIETLAGFDFFS